MPAQRLLAAARRPSAGGGAETPQRLARGPRTAVGFDFDCTLSTKHLYKALAWGYGSDGQRSHPHYAELVAWIKAHEPALPTGLPATAARGGVANEVAVVLDFLERQDSRACQRVLRDFFLGGDARIRSLAAAFAALAERGVQLM